MTAKDPKLFKDWSSYMRTRQVMLSAVIFKHHGWYGWDTGHVKLFGILLWYFETKNQRSFKYSKTLKKIGYRRTHNYRLLKRMIQTKVLCKECNGVYSFAASDVTIIQKALSLMKQLDRLEHK